MTVTELINHINDSDTIPSKQKKGLLFNIKSFVNPILDYYTLVTRAGIITKTDVFDNKVALKSALQEKDNAYYVCKEACKQLNNTCAMFNLPKICIFDINNEKEFLKFAKEISDSFSDAYMNEKTYEVENDEISLN